MPRWSATAAWVRTMSRIVTTGKREAHGRPSSGWGDAGPVVPWQPPRTLAHTTNQRSVSMASPGPIGALPPAGGHVAGDEAAGGVAVAGEGVAHEDCVVRGRGEGAPGLEGDGDPAQQAASLEGERAVVGQGQEAAPPHRVARSPRARDRQRARVHPAEALGRHGHGARGGAERPVPVDRRRPASGCGDLVSGSGHRACACLEGVGPDSRRCAPGGSTDTWLLLASRIPGEPGRHLGCPSQVAGPAPLRGRTALDVAGHASSPVRRGAQPFPPAPATRP